MDWLVTIVGVVGFYLAGKKVWWAWYVNIANQVLWLIFAVVTEQWGFLIGIPLYMSVFVKNAYDWTKEHRQTAADPYPVALKTSTLTPNEVRRIKKE